MNETELWIEQARTYLSTADGEDCSALVTRLREHLSRIDIEQAQADLGCGENCADCSWGTLGGYELPRETCKLHRFQHAVEELEARAAPRTAARREAAALRDLLDSLPFRWK